MNRYASSIYFSDTVNATKGNIERFPVVKAPGTLRIFVLGESTTVGYPYMHNGSFHRWLQYRLMHTFPDRDVEIINVSLTAVNSYTVLGFGKQVVDYQPDAVLVYTGHNEYYGALGVGSTSRIAGNRFLLQTVLRLRRLRLVQWFEAVIRSFHGHGEENPIDTREEPAPKRWRPNNPSPIVRPITMPVSASSVKIWKAFAACLATGKIPVFLSTLVSNEKDQPPLMSAAGSATGITTPEASPEA